DGRGAGHRPRSLAVAALTDAVSYLGRFALTRTRREGVIVMNPARRARTMATVGRPKRGVPEGLWIKCPQCKATIFRKEAESRFNVCPECDHHFYLPAPERIRQLLDEGSFEEWFADIRPKDPIGFTDRIPYAQRLEAEQKKTGMTDAAVVGKGYVRGRPVVFGITDFAFMAGSMGSVVGEKLTRAVEAATKLKLPLIIVSGSGGGARMQEGILSLMQMAKVSAAIAKYDAAGGLFVSILTNPTMGGVAASFALQGDVAIAEPGAMIGFAGKRTIWNTVRLELPQGFQTSEFLLQHGFVDRIVHRKDLRTEVATIIDYCER
ncbi:MAG TPA: acetyl-CoA carboxylase, carboxyltransferase subunit beta, partial [Gemmataceae bacterium]|nr:acetyl-CoA carboxylase, carboxyltransferase subunit beta [Gemmataceae bacterium]